MLGAVGDLSAHSRKEYRVVTLVHLSTIITIIIIATLTITTTTTTTTSHSYAGSPVIVAKVWLVIGRPRTIKGCSRCTIKGLYIVSILMCNQVSLYHEHSLIIAPTIVAMDGWAGLSRPTARQFP